MTTRENLKYRFFLEQPHVVYDRGNGIYGMVTKSGQTLVIRSSRQPQMSDRFLFINTQYKEGGGLLAVIGCDVMQDGSVTPYENRIIYPSRSQEIVNRTRELLKGNVPSKLDPSQLSMT